MKRSDKKGPGKKATFIPVLRTKVEEKVMHLKALISTYARSFARKRNIPVHVIKRVFNYLKEVLVQSKEDTVHVLSDMWNRAHGLA
jgi:hypothetical protein